MEHRMAHREDEIDLAEMLRAVYRKARWVSLVTVSVAVVAVVVSLLLPKYYEAESRIYPPQDRGGSLAAQLMGGDAGGLIALAGGAAGLKSQGELYVSMLKSRTVLDRVVDRYELRKLYDVELREEARDELLDLLTVREERKSGIIILTVEDRDPKRAAGIANAFVEELRTLSSGLAISEAGQRRMFFEEQLVRTKEALSRSEEDIKSFQQGTGMFQIDAQASAIIEGIARMRAGIAMKEVEAKVLRSFATARNPDLQRVEEEILALRAELAKLETPKGKGFDPLMSSGRVPELGMEYLRKLRQLKYNETLYVLLAKQFELAKLDEAKNAVVIQVIDQAVPPERKSRPKRGLIVLLATAGAFFLSVFIVLYRDRSWKNAGIPSAPTPADGSG